MCYCFFTSKTCPFHSFDTLLDELAFLQQCEWLLQIHSILFTDSENKNRVHKCVEATLFKLNSIILFQVRISFSSLRRNHFLYESFLSTPDGYTFLHHSKGQKSKCFNGRAYLINKLLGDFPCEARLEVTINACILVNWFFQVQCPKKMKRDTSMN